MKLGKKQLAFKADEITYLDRKTILLDRMLLKLFEVLRFDGRPVKRIRRRTLEIDNLVQAMAEDENRFPGFGARPEVARAWLRRDLLQIMNKDKPGRRETLVGPRPFHLNAYKLTNPKAVSDYGAADQVRALLFHADQQLLGLLKAFFGRGLDMSKDRYDGSSELDLETLAVLGLAEGSPEVHPESTPFSAPIRPLCVGQGRLMAEDLRRLLAYEDVVPRHVLADYIRNILGLHLGLYLLRLFRLLPDWVERTRSGERRPPCMLEEPDTAGASPCPYSFEIAVDLSESPVSPFVPLARLSAAEHQSAASAFVRAVITINRIKELVDVPGIGLNLTRNSSIEDYLSALSMLQQAPPQLDGFYLAKIGELLTLDKDEEHDAITAALRDLPLKPFDKYVELICHTRMKVERKKVIDLLDSLAQKNRPGGFMKQTAGARAARWFVLGGDLLETLVQIAVLERDPETKAFNSKSLLVDDFVRWLRERYGFVIYAPAHREVPPSEVTAWTSNLTALRESLRQIGFYTDLSDAFNSQTIRPRYEVKVHG